MGSAGGRCARLRPIDHERLKHADLRQEPLRCRSSRFSSRRQASLRPHPGDIPAAVLSALTRRFVDDAPAARSWARDQARSAHGGLCRLWRGRAEGRLALPEVLRHGAGRARHSRERRPRPSWLAIGSSTAVDLDDGERARRGHRTAPASLPSTSDTQTFSFA